MRFYFEVALRGLFETTAAMNIIHPFVINVQPTELIVRHAPLSVPMMLKVVVCTRCEVYDIVQYPYFW